MSGNDLQPLQEEVSKEEDESMLIKIEMLNNSVGNKKKFGSMTGPEHGQSMTSLGSECNYNTNIEEA